jgi:hypothetical protein
MHFPLPLSRLLLALFLSALSLSAQTPVAAPSLERLEAAHAKEISEKLDAAFLAGMQRLNDSYRLTLDSAAKKSAAQGDLDETVATQTEGKRFSAENNVPDRDEPGVNANVAKLRAFWRTEAARLAKTRAAGLQPLTAAYIASLRAMEKELTRSLKIDEAQAVRARADALTAEAAAAAPPPAATPAAVAPAPLPAATPKPAISFAPLGRPAERVDIWASANNGAIIYINNKEVAKGVMRDKPSKVRVGMKEGDVIAVKNPSRFSDNFFWLAVVSDKNEFLFESSPDWQCYIPKSHDKWWEVKTAIKKEPVQVYQEGKEYVDLVKQSASKSPYYHGTLPIHNPSKDEKLVNAPSYTYYLVRKDDLMPKKAEPTPR